MACGAERVGELAAEPGVLVGECLVAPQGSGEPGAQRGVTRPLACRDGIGGFAVVGAAQPLDLATDVGLGIEPGPGDPGSGCGGGERDRRACPVEFAQRLDGLCPGQLVPAGRGFRRAGRQRQDASAAASFPSPWPSASRVLMILSRLTATCLFISATRRARRPRRR